MGKIVGKIALCVSGTWQLVQGNYETAMIIFAILLAILILERD